MKMQGTVSRVGSSHSFDLLDFFGLICDFVFNFCFHILASVVECSNFTWRRTFLASKFAANELQKFMRNETNCGSNAACCAVRNEIGLIQIWYAVDGNFGGSG